ncbi:MAG: tRNA pseudouridine(55) synthase TruB [Candidatus Wallbacteria bacterium]|nr:tRNA pseudouridine(55) synthase TruB [Candidatus Wallbacteria bacterium]
MINDLNGLIILNKPAGVGSLDTIRRLKKKFPDLSKTGFLGTLDPMATGVLPLFTGLSTKLIPFIRNNPKVYRLKIRFGIATDSYDCTGKVTKTALVDPDLLNQQIIGDLLSGFLGEIDQVPPPLSACKSKGKRAYDLFFSGQPVTLPSRKKEIYEIDFKGFFPGENPEAELVVSCESGTYMRSLAVDIGNKVNLPAHLSYLCRLSCGDFLISEAVGLETLLEQGLEKYLEPPDRFLPYPEVIITENSTYFQLVKNGNQLKNIWNVPDGLIKIKDNRQNLLAIYKSRGNFLAAAKVLL